VATTLDGVRFPGIIYPPAVRGPLALNALKPSLVQSDRGLEYGSTHVVDMADLSNAAKLPTAPQPVEIVERTGGRQSRNYPACPPLNMRHE